jgi:hypothetical protein
MPLNLEVAENDGEEFYDKLRFNAQGGVWYVKQDGVEKRFPNGFKAVLDMAAVATGWARFNGTYLDFIADPSLEQPAPMPALDADDENKWDRSFRVQVYSKDAFGGVVQFTHTARCVRVAFAELYVQYEGQAGGGKVPVVEVGGDPVKAGDYYAPNWKIAKMINRPAALREATAPAPVAAAPVAPVAVAPVAPAPASDEEF